MRIVKWAALAVVVTSSPLAAQRAGPADAPAREAAPADVESIEAILTAVYDVISGPAGEPRDWDRWHTLFIDGARLIPAARTPEGQWRPNVTTPEQFAEFAGRYFADNPFYEVEAARRVERYGHIAHVFSTYESRRDPAEEPFVRGINSFQLFFDGSRWWVVSIMWDDEGGGGEIPARYLQSGH